MLASRTAFQLCMSTSTSIIDCLDDNRATNGKYLELLRDLVDATIVPLHRIRKECTASTFLSNFGT